MVATKTETRNSVRVTAYVKPALRDQIDLAIEASDQTQQEWLREALGAAVNASGHEEPADNTQELLQIKLEAAESKNDLLEEHLADAKGQRDASNASNERLETLLAQSQATVATMTRALPAGGESSWWKRLWARV